MIVEKMLKVAPAEEEWRDIPEYKGRYQASSHGRIRSVARIVRACNLRYWRPSRILSARPVFGYPTVTVCVGGKRKQLLVHRAVCAAFHGPAPSGKRVVAHADGSRTNNRPENLRWATYSENQYDKVAHGRSPLPKVIDEATAREIISRLNGGETQKAIAESMGLKRWTVQHIRLGRSWKSLHHLIAA
jgi:hypothetical protein